MAAHVLKALRELEKHPDQIEAFHQAMGYAQLGDNLEYSDWQAIDQAIKSGDEESAAHLAISLIPKYERIHSLLREPRTAEEWGHARYGSRHTEIANEIARMGGERLTAQEGGDDAGY